MSLETDKAGVDSLRNFVVDLENATAFMGQWLEEAKASRAELESALRHSRALSAALETQRQLINRIILAWKGKVQRADEAIERLEQGFASGNTDPDDPADAWKRGGDESP